MSTGPAMFTGFYWLPAIDGEDESRAIHRRHYSHRRYADGRKPKLFVGPGEKYVLRSADGRALWVWRKFIDDCIDTRTGQRQAGVNCAIFRNESGHDSPAMIREAVALAWRKWPGERLYTYVDPRKVKSANPGYCYKLAGWRFCGRDKGGKHVLEMLPAWAVSVGLLAGKSSGEVQQ
jgi:hypothetical protein